MWRCSGNAATSRVPRDDGDAQGIFRCQRCQIAVFSEYGRRELRYVRAGTLDDPIAITPDVHIYTRSKVDWVTLPPATPAFEEYYATDKLWPAASYRRLAAVLSRDR